jgi:hypothetical protein
MAVTFPTSPTTGQTYTYSNIVYTWDGKRWVRYNSAAIPALIGNSGRYLATDGTVLSWANGTPGFTGSAGPAGGYTGSSGYSGSTGFVGSQGPAGGYTGSSSTVAGYTGSVGAGYTGSASTVAGYTGSIGVGYTGSSSTVAGYTGSVGVGYTGSVGFNNTLSISTGLSGTSYNGTAPITIAIDSTVTTNAGTQTLTNKTITGLSNASTVLDYSDSQYQFGFRNMPQSGTTSGNLTLGDSGKHVYVSSGVTVPPNSSVAFEIGAVITVVSNATALTITQGSGVTLKWANSSSTGNRSLASNGIATLLKVATDTWYIFGLGLT